MPTSPLIQLQHLVKRFGDKVAVDEVSLEVCAGEIFGFLGPNGAGKTTTIQMLVGLLQPTSGAVRVAGYDVQAQPLGAKAACGYVPDEPNLYAKLTARELLRRVGDLYGVERAQAERRSEELLRLFDLAAAADDTFDSYSHGMKQKTALAAALVHDPRVLVLDEPTAGLDQVGPADQGHPAPDGRPRRGGVPLDPHPRNRRAHVRPHRHHRPWPVDRRGHHG